MCFDKCKMCSWNFPCKMYFLSMYYHVPLGHMLMLRRHINNLKVSPVGVGLMGYMGNKVNITQHKDFRGVNNCQFHVNINTIHFCCRILGISFC
ncbi:nucleosome assembly protein 1,4-like [Iris pallida]|uniref:Nucleosome assembly protein 1,4-like n=1 Tax=Iris pallida TaxID=29817 RepID=A0AAX6ILI4_IRIPA|nr:nucleosome assembly protein 1,4-like [Iris pallida]KAJ6853275.1 nucleosome assembly protein 1,4-like [Iris pallida]